LTDTMCETRLQMQSEIPPQDIPRTKVWEKVGMS